MIKQRATLEPQPVGAIDKLPLGLEIGAWHVDERRFNIPPLERDPHFIKATVGQVLEIAPATGPSGRDGDGGEPPRHPNQAPQLRMKRGLPDGEQKHALDGHLRHNGIEDSLQLVRLELGAAGLELSPAGSTLGTLDRTRLHWINADEVTLGSHGSV